MNISSSPRLLILLPLVGLLWLVACQAAPLDPPTPTPPPTATVTHTPAPTATATVTPSPTPEPWTLAPYPDELAAEELTVQLTADGTVQALDHSGRVAAAWDGSAWVRVLPPLPEWAEAYAKHHQGEPEEIEDKWYYTVDRTVEANGETRAVQVKLLELDEKGEWLPCYETIEELLTNKQLMTLMKLNQISAPEEALWLVRTGETIETEREDLVKLEQIIARFMEANDHLFGEEGWGGIIVGRQPLNNPEQSTISIGRLIELRQTEDFLIDGVDISYPHAYLVVRRGVEDQVLLGGIPLRFQHTSVFAGYDASVVEAAYGDLGKYAEYYTTNLDEIVAVYQNLNNDKRLYVPFFKQPTGSATSEVALYYSLDGVNPRYGQELEDAARGWFYDFNPFFSQGKVYWLHAVPKIRS